MRMNPKRSRDEDDESFTDRELANPSISPGGEPMEALPGRLPEEDVDGQLGPDELSDPQEVVMNLESKRHH
jgi:hypothetical protein